MEASQNRLRGSVMAWNEKRRYKINQLVDFGGRIYQNFTGVNSSPDLLDDWIVVKDNLTGSFSAYSNEFPYLGVDTFTIPLNLVIVSVLFNGFDTSNYSVLGTVLTVSDVMVTDDVIKVRGVLV